MNIKHWSFKVAMFAAVVVVVVGIGGNLYDKFKAS